MSILRHARTARSPGPATSDAVRLLATRRARATRARIAVLSVLLSAREALSHHEIERKLQRGHDVDRVTLYRVLDWLTGQGLAHKLAGDDRVWRFSVGGVIRGEGTSHPHFQCNECGRVICLEQARMPVVPLPRGFRRSGVEVTVKGSCDACARA